MSAWNLVVKYELFLSGNSGSSYLDEIQFKILDRFKT